MKVKKLIIFFIAIICIFSINILDLSAEGNDDFSYTVKDGEVLINGYNGYNTNIVIPEEIDGLPVTTVSCLFSSPNIEEFDSITLSKNIDAFDQGWMLISRVPFLYTKTKKFIVIEDNTAFASYNGALYSKDLKDLMRAPSNDIDVFLLSQELGKVKCY